MLSFANRLQVAVVGAGPAGCAASIALARSGIKTLVLERGKARKDKACGDALVPQAIEGLQRLGITSGDIAALGGVSFTHIDLSKDHQLLWRHCIQGTGWVVPRVLIDQRLRDEAAKHVTVAYEAAVIDVMLATSGVWTLTVRTPSRDVLTQSEGVVLATGAASWLARKWAVSGNPVVAASISSYCERKAGQGLGFDFTESCFPGYRWEFPVGVDRVNVGVCGLLPRGTFLRRRAAAYLEELGLSSSLGMRGGAGPVWSGQSRIWHHQAGLLSCGDCAGLVDPITGEGISAALISGERAGLALSDYLLEDRNPVRLEQFSRWLREYFHNEYGNTSLRRIWASLSGLTSLQYRPNDLQTARVS